VIFFSGETNYVFNISIIDDNLLEPVESFNLTIQSLSGDATIGNLDHVMISIFDNDGESMQDYHYMIYVNFYRNHGTAHSTIIHCCRKNWNSTTRIEL